MMSTNSKRKTRRNMLAAAISAPFLALLPKKSEAAPKQKPHIREKPPNPPEMLPGNLVVLSWTSEYECDVHGDIGVSTYCLGTDDKCVTFCMQCLVEHIERSDIATLEED